MHIVVKAHMNATCQILLALHYLDSVNNQERDPYMKQEDIAQ